MSENNRNIDELFRQELGNATEAPPSSVWEALEQRLDQAPPPKKGIWGSYRLFVLFLIGAALIASYFIWHSGATKDSKPVPNETGAGFSTRLTAPAPAGQVGSGKDTARMLQAASTTAKDSLQALQSSKTKDHIASSGRSRGPEGNKAIPASALHEKQSAQTGKTADRNTAKKAGSGRPNGVPGQQDEQQTNSGRQANLAPAKKVPGRQATATATESSTAQQRPIADLKHTAQGAGGENNLGGTKPGQNGTTATAPKTGSLRRSTGTDGAGVSKELRSSSAHGARTQNTGKGQSAVSLTATEQSRLREKAVNTEQAAAIPSTAVSAKAMPAGKSSKGTSSSAAAGIQQGKISKETESGTETAISGSGQAKAITATSAQEQLPGKNTNTGKVAAEQAKTASNSSKEALATNSTNKSAAIPEQSKLPGKTVNTGKAAAEQGKAIEKTVSNGKALTTEQPKALPEAKIGKETTAKSNTAPAGTAQDKANEKTVSNGKVLTAEQSKALPTAKIGKETTAKSNTAPAGTAQDKANEKTVSNGKVLTAEQPKALPAAKSGKEATAKSNTAPAGTAQDKANEKTVSNGKALTAEQPKALPEAKSGKETKAKSNTAQARAAQDKAIENSGNTGKAVLAQPTARQAKTEAKSALQASAQQRQEKKAATGKNEMPQNESPEDQATAGGESSGGNTLPLAKEKTRRPLNMSAGIKAAYEKGFQSYTANTIVASVFGEVNFSPKVSFIIQPGIKVANTSSEYRTANGTYIRAGNVETTMYYEERDSMNFPTGYKNYAYRQTYDSIVAYRQAQKKFTEFELPFLVRYKMDKNLSFLAGMNFTFGKTLKMEGILQYNNGLSLADSIFHFYDTLGGPPSPPIIFAHSGSVPFSAYKDPAATQVINMIRFGYTFGLSYTVRQRLIVDLTLQQNLSRLSDIDDEQIKKLFTQPYVRLSVGYSILGRRK